VKHKTSDNTTPAMTPYIWKEWRRKGREEKGVDRWEADGKVKEWDGRG